MKKFIKNFFGDKGVSSEEAKKIMGENMFDETDMARLFGLGLKDFPPCQVPYSKKLLKTSALSNERYGGIKGRKILLYRPPISLWDVRKHLPQEFVRSRFWDEVPAWGLVAPSPAYRLIHLSVCSCDSPAVFAGWPNRNKDNAKKLVARTKLTTAVLGLIAVRERFGQSVLDTLFHVGHLSCNEAFLVGDYHKSGGMLIYTLPLSLCVNMGLPDAGVLPCYVPLF